MKNTKGYRHWKNYGDGSDKPELTEREKLKVSDREAIIHYNIFGGIRPIMKPTLTDNIIYGLTTSSEEKAKIAAMVTRTLPQGPTI